MRIVGFGRIYGVPSRSAHSSVQPSSSQPAWATSDNGLCAIQPGDTEDPHAFENSSCMWCNLPPP